VIDILTGFGFAVVGGKKHIKLRRGGPDGDETLIVPNHSPSQKARYALFFSQASRYVHPGELHPHFYND
jgi:hypothetical protein